MNVKRDSGGRVLVVCLPAGGNELRHLRDYIADSLAVGVLALPEGSEVQVLDHHAITAVECELAVDGVRLCLRRTYFEKWSSKRGSAQETFDGHSSDFFVDGVPVKKYEYARRVDELVDEDRFRLLTNVHYFCGALGWKERRAAKKAAEADQEASGHDGSPTPSQRHQVVPAAVCPREVAGTGPAPPYPKRRFQGRH